MMMTTFFGMALPPARGAATRPPGPGHRGPTTRGETSRRRPPKALRGGGSRVTRRESGPGRSARSPVVSRIERVEPRFEPVRSGFDPLENLEHKTRAWLAGQLLRALLATAGGKANRIGVAVEL